jgi:hypothetical protein
MLGEKEEQWDSNDKQIYEYYNFVSFSLSLFN